MNNNVIDISRGRELATERLLKESAKISLLLAMANPPKNRETVAQRVQRTKIAIVDEFTDAGYEVDQAHRLAQECAHDAYAEFLKVS